MGELSQQMGKPVRFMISALIGLNVFFYQNLRRYMLDQPAQMESFDGNINIWLMQWI